MFSRYLLSKFDNFMDRDRVAVSGVSYGGYVAGMMLSETSQNHSTLLKCGVAVCPVVDWRYYGEQNFRYGPFGLVYRKPKITQNGLKQVICFLGGLMDQPCFLCKIEKLSSHFLDTQLPIKLRFLPQNLVFQTQFYYKRILKNSVQNGPNSVFQKYLRRK